MADKNAVITENDYSELLKEEFDMEIQSEAFGFNCTLSIEGSTCEYHNKYQNDKIYQGRLNMYFHSHYSDDSVNDEDILFGI